jgi:hypothetical protein
VYRAELIEEGSTQFARHDIIKGANHGFLGVRQSVVVHREGLLRPRENPTVCSLLGALLECRLVRNLRYVKEGLPNSKSKQT